MSSMFADSLFFFAILNMKDQAHQKAIAFSNQHKARVVTTTWVLAEVADGLARFASRRAFRQLVAEFRAGLANEIVPATEEAFERGMDLYDKRPDKQWSLTD